MCSTFRSPTVAIVVRKRGVIPNPSLRVYDIHRNQSLERGFHHLRSLWEFLWTSKATFGFLNLPRIKSVSIQREMAMSIAL